MVQFLCAAAVAISALSIAAPAAPADKYEGKVVTVGEGTITIRSDASSENHVFVVDGSTVITRNSKPAQLKDVQIADKVEIAAVTVGEKLIAKRLTALAPE